MNFDPLLEKLRTGEFEVPPREGDAVPRDDAEELFRSLYGELRALAARQMDRERPGNTLSATALVHEAYLQLVETDTSDGPAWQSPEHFFRCAAKMMRHLLIDHARAKGADKRGGAWRKLGLDAVTVEIPEADPALVELDEALHALQKRYPVHAEVVELRFFAGRTGDGIAADLGIAPATVDRHWAFARAWLFDWLERNEGR